MLVFSSVVLVVPFLLVQTNVGFSGHCNLPVSSIGVYKKPVWYLWILCCMSAPHEVTSFLH